MLCASYTVRVTLHKAVQLVGTAYAVGTYPEVCEAVLPLHILHPEPDLPVGI